MQQLNLIPRAQLCEKLGVSRSTLKRWAKTRNFPQPIKASGREPIYDIRPHHGLNMRPPVPETLIEKSKNTGTENWG